MTGAARHHRQRGTRPLGWPRAHIGLAVALVSSLAWACASSPSPRPDPEAEAQALALASRIPSGTTLGRLLDAAYRGDRVSERLVGYRLFYGESAPLDRGAALYWFERAAANGDPVAQVNMALLHELGINTPRDRQAALRYFRLARGNPGRPADLGLPSLLGIVGKACAPPRDSGDDAEVFGTFCAGCHGRLGLAAHPDAPNFALGERLEKSDLELLTTVRKGHGEMPEWSDKLPPTLMQAALRQARRLRDEFGHGTLRWVPPRPRLNLRFGAADRGAWDFEADPTGLPPGVSLPEACGAR